MPDLQIRKLDVSEFEKFRDLRIKALLDSPTAFSQFYEKYDDETDAKWRKWLEASVTEEKSVMLFALEEDNAVGMAGAIFDDNPKTMHVAELFGVFVDKDYRSKGISSTLMQSLFDKLIERGGITKIKLAVNNEQKAAINLYSKFGFKKVGQLSKELKVEGKYYDLDVMEYFF